MRYIRVVIDGPEVHLYPLVCLHIGAKQSCQKLIDFVIKQIKNDPLARWAYLGDAGECVVKGSKGNIYEQLMNPGDQMREAARLFEPIKEKGLFGIRGNHGNRIDKETGVGWDEMLCTRIGIPYLGVSAFLQLELKRPRDNSNMSCSIYVHHGASGAITPAGKVTAGKKAEAFIVADLILTAHSHASGEIPCPHHYAYLDGQSRDIRWGTVRSFLCGSAYDSRSGYAEEKMYPPILPEHIILNLKVGRKTCDNERHIDRSYFNISHQTIFLDPATESIRIK